MSTLSKRLRQLRWLGDHDPASLVNTCIWGDINVRRRDKRIAELAAKLEAVLDAARPVFDARPTYNLRRQLAVDKWQTECSMGVIPMIQLRKLLDAVDAADSTKT